MEIQRIDPPIYLVWSSWICVSNFVALAVASKLIHEIRRENKNREISSFNTKLIICNLSVCDSITGVVILVSLLAARGDFESFTRAGCGAYSTVLGFSTVSSLVLVLLLGFVRYRSLTETPLSEIATKRGIVLAYFLSAIYAIIPSISGDIEVQPSKLWCFHVIGRQNGVSTFMTVTTLLACVVPAVTLLACYAQVFREIRVAEQVLGSGSKYSPRVARLGVSIVLTYFITVLPFAVMVAYRLFTAPENKISPLQDSILCFIIIVNFGLNPIIYFAFQRDFRRILVEWLEPIVRLSTRTSTQDSESGQSAEKNKQPARSTSAHAESIEVSGKQIFMTVRDYDEQGEPSSSKQEHQPR